jgi:hypothetical protein
VVQCAPFKEELSLRTGTEARFRTSNPPFRPVAGFTIFDRHVNIQQGENNDEKSNDRMRGNRTHDMRVGDDI